jgi:hypothetical protein
MNARKIKRRIHASMARHFAHQRFLRQYSIFDYETYHDAFSFGPSAAFDELMDEIFKPKNPHSAVEDARYMVDRLHAFDANFVANRLGKYPHAEINAIVKAEDVPFPDEPAEAVLTYSVARVKDDVVVLTTDDKAEAEEAVAKAVRQKRARLYILETEKV